MKIELEQFKPVANHQNFPKPYAFINTCFLALDAGAGAEPVNKYPTRPLKSFFSKQPNQHKSCAISITCCLTLLAGAGTEPVNGPPTRQLKSETQRKAMHKAFQDTAVPGSIPQAAAAALAGADASHNAAEQGVTEMQS